MRSATLPLNEPERLAALRAYQILDTTPEAAFDDVTRLASEICGTPIALITLIDEGRQWFKSRVGLEAYETNRDLAFCAHAILEPQQPLIVEETLDDVRFHDNPMVTADPKIRFYAGWPLVTAAGEALGALCVIDQKPKSLSPLQVETMRVLANQVTREIELRQLLRLNVDYTNQLFERKKKLRAVLNTTIDGIVTVDEAGIVLTLNPAAERMFGYAEQEVIGKEIQLLMPESGVSQPDAFTGSGGTSGETGIGAPEVQGRRKDGGVFPIELGASSFEADGRLTLVLSLHDISLRKRAEQTARRHLVQLERSNQELDEFAYIASHDLKEPLRGLSNNARFLLDDHGDTLAEAGVKRIERIVFLCERMERLVNDLLYYSRLGRQELAIGPVDLGASVREIEAMMETTLRDANARIVITERLPTIVGDRPRIQEVFRNLIGNAIKYNDKPEKRIEIGRETRQGEQVFFVRDNGIGIAPEFHDDVFRIFKRLNIEDDAVKGTGVGLTFVKKIIERHHGRVWIEPEGLEGTKICFTIPEPQKA